MVPGSADEGEREAFPPTQRYAKDVSDFAEALTKNGKEKEGGRGDAEKALETELHQRLTAAEGSIDDPVEDPIPHEIEVPPGFWAPLDFEVPNPTFPKGKRPSSRWSAGDIRPRTPAQIAKDGGTPGTPSVTDAGDDGPSKRPRPA